MSDRRGLEQGPIHRSLTDKVQRILRDARIVLTSLPQIPSIRLCLLSEDYPQGRLSAGEAEKIMSEPPYWSFCWASGQVLAKWILRHKDVVAGKTVLDFGAGSGVIAIAAALAGARRVVALDADPLAREAVKVNADINEIDIQVSDDFEKAASEGIEVLFAADVLYDKENFPFLDLFVRAARQIYVADSRVRDLSQPPYRKIGEGTAVSWPDLDEPAEFRQVSIYHAHGLSSSHKC
jgi:predicted nicotinamide N-methyase